MAKVVLITGASRGIGRMMAIRFAEEGYLVAANYCSNDKMANELLGISSNIRTYKADVADRDQVINMVNSIHSELGPIDVLINNAAISSIKLFSDITQKEWERIFAINVNGAFNCTQAVMADMIHNKRGSIINISSMWGQVGSSCEVHYSTTKAALIGFTKALAKELGPCNIRVNCIAPGIIDTDMNSSLDLSSLQEETPLGRIGSVLDVAECALFLSSDKSSFITGQVLGINGGLVM